MSIANITNPRTVLRSNFILPYLKAAKIAVGCEFKPPRNRAAQSSIGASRRFSLFKKDLKGDDEIPFVVHQKKETPKSVSFNLFINSA